MNSSKIEQPPKKRQLKLMAVFEKLVFYALEEI